MKKSKKLLAMLMGTAMLTTSLLAGGCGNAATASKYQEGATEGRPNYDISEDAPTFDIWSYGQTCDDHYFISSEPIYFLDEQGMEHELAPYSIGLFQQCVLLCAAVGLESKLCDTISVTKVDESHTAHFADTLCPPCEGDCFACIGET